MKDILPAAIRRRIYYLFAWAGICIGGVQVGFATASSHQPVALTVVLAVYAYLGTALGFTAGANTTPEEE